MWLSYNIQSVLGYERNEDADGTQMKRNSQGIIPSREPTNYFHIVRM